jgi:hypothetical protein
MILSDYRARDATRWSNEEIFEAAIKNKFRTRSNNIFEDDIDAEHENIMQLGLNDRFQREILQKVSFTDELLNQFKHCLSQYHN